MKGAAAFTLASHPRGAYGPASLTFKISPLNNWKCPVHAVVSVSGQTPFWTTAGHQALSR